MTALTEESLEKLNKPDLLALVVNLQSKMDTVNGDLVAELRKMRVEFYQMKSDLSVTKKSEHSIIRKTLHLFFFCFIKIN